MQADREEEAVFAGFISYHEDSGFSLFLNFSLRKISNIHMSRQV